MYLILACKASVLAKEITNLSRSNSNISRRSVLQNTMPVSMYLQQPSLSGNSVEEKHKSQNAFKHDILATHGYQNP
jgi:hypothetical protein